MRKPNIRNILVPIDFSAMSIQAIEKAKALAMQFGAIDQGTPEHMRASRHPVVVQFLSGSLDGPILNRSKYHMLSPPD